MMKSLYVLASALLTLISFNVWAGSPAPQTHTSNAINRSHNATNATSQAQQALAQKQESPGQPGKKMIDPFSGKSLSYEQLRNQYQSASIQAKIERARYQVARYRHQITQMGGQSAQNSHKSSSKQNKAVSQLKAQMSSLESQISTLKQQRKHAQRQAKKASHPKHAPKLLAIYKTGQGHNEAMVKYKGNVRSIGAGGHLGSWSIEKIKGHEAVLRNHHQHKVLRLADSAGHMRNTGQRAYTKSGYANMQSGGGQNSGSNNAINQQLQRQAQALAQ